MSKQSEKVIRWRKRLKTKIVKAMGGSCQCCGYNRCDGALELHHIDPSQKEFGFGRIRASPKGLEVLKLELKKCILVCSNCHREIHAGVLDIPKTWFTLDESVLISESEIKRRLKADHEKENHANI